MLTASPSFYAKKGNMNDAFAGYHPAIGFIFFISAIVTGMFFVHPVFLGVSIVASALYYLLLTGRRGIKFLYSMLFLFIAISLINPLFNTLGETVLFTYFGGRCFTLEALMYGFATSGMFLSVLLWFALLQQNHDKRQVYLSFQQIHSRYLTDAVNGIKAGSKF